MTKWLVLAVVLVCAPISAANADEYEKKVWQFIEITGGKKAFGQILGATVADSAKIARRIIEADAKKAGVNIEPEKLNAVLRRWIEVYKQNITKVMFARITEEYRKVISADELDYMIGLFGSPRYQAIQKKMLGLQLKMVRIGQEVGREVGKASMATVLKEMGPFVKKPAQ